MDNQTDQIPPVSQPTPSTLVVLTEKDFPIRAIWLLKNSARPFFTYFAFIFGIVVLTAVSSSSSNSSSSFSTFQLLEFGFIIVSAPLLILFNILTWKNFHFSLDNQFLNLSQGVLSKQNRQIPYGVIQDVFVEQDLFDRIFGLASLRIENAAQAGMMPVTPRHGEMLGFKGSLVSIPGLSKESAEKLKDTILQKMHTTPTKEMGI